MILLENKRISFDYEILDTFEAGIILEGWEVKSLRAKHGNLKPAWVRIDNGITWLENCTIPTWRYSREVQEKSRPRKLLLHTREIEKLAAKANEKGRTIAPTKIYTKGKVIKCEIIVGKGRKKYEKRQVLKNRMAEREARKTMKNFNNSVQ
jgi:SsrA-binding protein